MISVQDFSYRFAGAAQPALHDVNLDIAAGEFVVIAGPSGCGKSTLALALGGYLFSQYDGEASGRVLVDGLDVRHTPVYDVAEVVGLVQQNPEAQFCTLTVQDEIAFGLENRRLPRAEIRQRIDRVLSIVGATQLRDRELATLSGGEQQKIAIAAILAAEPQVLILDEPTSSLDPPATEAILRVIADLRARANLTVIVIEHKIAPLSPYAPRLLRMREGSVIDDRQLTPEDTAALLPVIDCAAASGADGPPVVRVLDLSAGHNGTDVLRDLSVKIAPGEFVTLMGDNGSGKTTFLHCLLGLTQPRQGRVEVLGQYTDQARVSALVQRAGIVFQNPEHQLFASSVWEEAIFAPRNLGLLDGAVETQARDLLDRCGLAGRGDEHPYRLSYGQKRRLNLISLLTYRPALVLLDEILIGQDPDNAEFLLGLLCEHARSGGTVIMADHHPAVLRRYATRVIFLDAGRIVIDAPVAEGFAQLAALGKTAYVPPYEDSA